MRVLVIVSLGAGALGLVLPADTDSIIRGRDASSGQMTDLKASKVEHEIQRTRLIARTSQRLGLESLPSLYIKRASATPAEGSQSARLTRRMISRQPSSSTPRKFPHSYSEGSMQQSQTKSDSLGGKSKSLSQLNTKGSSRDSSPWRHGTDSLTPGGGSPPRKTNSQGSFRGDSPWVDGGGAVHNSAPIRHSIMGFSPGEPYPPPSRTSSPRSTPNASSLSRASSLLRTGSPPKTGGLSRGGSFAREGKLSRTVSFAQDIATPFAGASSPSGSDRTGKGLSRASSFAREGSLSDPSTPRTPRTPAAKTGGSLFAPQTPTTPTTPITPSTPSTPLERWKSGP